MKIVMISSGITIATHEVNIICRGAGPIDRTNDVIRWNEPGIKQSNQIVVAD